MPDEEAVATEGVEAAGSAPVDEGEEHKPRGTMFIMLVFLALIALLWTATYLTLLSRG